MRLSVTAWGFCGVWDHGVDHGVEACSWERLRTGLPEAVPGTTCQCWSEDSTAFVFATKAGNTYFK